MQKKRERGTNNRSDKLKINNKMMGLNLIIPLITSNISVLKTPNKRQRFRGIKN